MPITKQAEKKLHRDEVRARQNEHMRKTLHALVKAARKTPSNKSLTAVFRALDKAAKRRIIHQNKAARLKSRLARLLKKK